MKKCICLLLIFLTLLSFAACNKKNPNPSDYLKEDEVDSSLEQYDGSPNECGNSPGNIVNGGMATIKDDWIYFIMQSDREVDDGKIFAMKTDGSDFQEIVGDKFKTSPKEFLKNGNTTYLNVVGDRMFYCTGGDIYTMKTNGSDYRQLYDNNTDGSVDELTVVGGWMYYTLAGGSMYKMETNGSNKTSIGFGNKGHDLNVVEDQIYYVNMRDNNSMIYTMKTDGSDKYKLCDDVGVQSLQVIGDRIYYKSQSGGFSIYTIKTDGSDRREICDDYTYYLNVTDEWIYYVTTTSRYLCRIKPDGSQKQQLDSGIHDTSSFGVNVVGDWIFVLNYRMKTDGSSKQFN